MTANQYKKMKELSEIIRRLEIYETGPNEDIDRAKVLIHEVCVESDHNPFSEHWRNDEQS